MHDALRPNSGPKGGPKGGRPDLGPVAPRVRFRRTAGKTECEAE